ncbi:linker for activation of T-cells family member 2 isoform X2 [Saimiri boliviensis]|uniref:linker for activation of T-cells family member 2 isoform X2 n=1 Tax=Saimiri boliviensis TaxID=27679 RepID=UPI000533C41C
MSPGTELLWPGAALLVLLGVAASLCARCSRLGAKRSEKIYQQRSLHEDQQSFMGSQTYSLVGQAWPGALADTAPARKDKLLQFCPSLEDPASPRYQNFSKGSRHGSEDAYVDPIAMEYYNWGRFPKPPEDDDANSYENVLICKQKTTEPGAQQEGTGGLCGEHSPCPSVPLEEEEESEDYQNSASIRQWRESRRAMGRWPGGRRRMVGPLRAGLRDWPGRAGLSGAFLQPVQLTPQ